MKLICLVVVLSSILSIFGYIEIMEDFEEYREEGECIAELISLGIERRDIITGNGTCHVRK